MKYIHGYTWWVWFGVRRSCSSLFFLPTGICIEGVLTPTGEAPVHWKSRFFKAAISCISMITCPAVRNTVTCPNLCLAKLVWAKSQVKPLKTKVPRKNQSKGRESTPTQASQVPFLSGLCQDLQLLHALEARPEAQLPKMPAGHSSSFRQRYTERMFFSLSKSTQKPASCWGSSLPKLQLRPFPQRMHCSSPFMKPSRFPSRQMHKEGSVAPCQGWLPN